MKKQITFVPNVALHQGNSLVVMKSIPDCTFDLTVTSPPYDNLRTYKDSLEWGEHVWKPLLQELFRTTKQGGVVVWVVNDATINGGETGTSFKQALHAMECGFNLHDTMIWEKDGFVAVGALKTRYAPVFEYMFVLSKGKVKTFNPIKDKPNKHAGKKLGGTKRQADGSTKVLSGAGVKVFAEFGQRYNVWRVNKDQSRTGHPAAFPESLCEDHILSWSNEGDTVFDPFLGSGTTGKMAVLNGRNFIGVEKVEEYYAISEKRINEALGSIVRTSKI